MRLALTEDEQALRDSVRGALKGLWEPGSVRLPAEQRDLAVRAVSSRLRELGVTGMTLSESADGGGVDLSAALPVALELGRILAPASLLRSAVVAPELLHRCSTPAATSLAERVVSGEVSPTVIFTSAGHGSFVCGARYADVLIVAAVGRDECTVRTVTTGEVRLPDGTDDPIDSCWDLRAWEPPEQAGQLLGVLPADNAAQVWAGTTMLEAAYGVGGIQALVTQSVSYARVREQFGTPIGAQQAVQHRLATMATQCYLAECAVLASAEPDAAADRLYSFVLSTYQDVAEQAIQVHGAIGFTWECDVHLYLRNAMASRALVAQALPTRPERGLHATVA